MMSCQRKFSCHQEFESAYNYKDSEQRYMITPFIVTFCEGTLTDIDIQSFLEAGLRIVRFRMGPMKRDKLILFDMLKSAVDLCCKKYYVATWPVAITIDLPNALIQTGLINKDLQTSELFFEKGNFVELTSDAKYWNKCDLRRIYIDDKYIIKRIKPKQQISIPVASLNLICTEVINDKTVKCEIISDGLLTNRQVVCFRGLKIDKPPLTNLDMQLIEFVKENEFDVVVINSIRKPSTAHRTRRFFINCHVPLIFGSIAEEEGLNNIDDIIEACDGIVLAREFLSESIQNINQMTAVQLNICAKCKQVGKPIFISGNVLEQTMRTGQVCYSEVNDVTNIVLQGAGLIMRQSSDPANVLKSLYLLSSISKTVEPISQDNNYWRLTMELQPPVNAAEAAVIASAVAARQYGANVIILLTVSGKTAMQLSRIFPKSFIISVSTDAKSAQRLQLFRGIIPIIYKRKGKEDWYADMKSRVVFAIKHCIQHELLKFKAPYAVLRKSSPTSAFCDQFSLNYVTGEEETDRNKMCL